MRPIAEFLFSEAALRDAAIALGALRVAGVSAAEQALAREAAPLAAAVRRRLVEEIRAGLDPLGTAFAQLRSAQVRRGLGATYTPPAIVGEMLAWARQQPEPDRVLDPGTGSGRFLCAAGQAFSAAMLHGIEVDPLAALLARANLAASGLAARARVDLQDFRALPAASTGRTLFIGNPPYVRHHQIGPAWKQWLVQQAAGLGLKASQLAGLHVHFMLATALQARPGDHGCYITAAEWLDVNYGQLPRRLFLGPLGGQGIVIVEPTAEPFPDAASTAAIATFRVGLRPSSVRMRRVTQVAQLGGLSGGRPVRRERLEAEPRWSRLGQAGRERREGFIELGELCRVHRGAVTGANRVFVTGPHDHDVPARFKLRTVTRARELIGAGDVLQDASSLRCVVDLPEDLDQLALHESAGVERFLRHARASGAHEGYVARNRRAWWSVGLRAPAPILATYMARRAPAFVHNAAQARHINIAHGLYPREPLTETQLRNLLAFLRTRVDVQDGRTYAGGLTKFEPREMERLLVPSLEQLATSAWT